MYYSFNNNVYFVSGSYRGCVYDFNTSKLYSVNHELSCLLDSISKESKKIETYGDAEKKILKELLNRNLLIITDKPQFNSIYDLAETINSEFAWIEVTTRCNLKCKHCYNESSSYTNSDMSLDDFKETIEYLSNLKIRRIQLIGGEPFCHCDLRQMIDYALGKFDFIEIFTNGTLIDSDWVSYFKENNINVALSVYSYMGSIHDDITGFAESWKKVNRTIEKLKKHKVKYRVCNVLMKGVVLGEKNTDLYELNPDKDIVRMSGRANLDLLSEELVKKKLITKRTFQVPIHEAFTKRLISGHNCFSRNIYVSTEKRVYPCVMERRISHGVIQHGSLMLDKGILKLNKDNVNVCKNCEYRFACFDCRADSCSENVYEKPWYCTYEPKSGVWMDIDRFISNLNIR